MDAVLEQIFSVAGGAAMLGWIALIFAPRWPALLSVLVYGIVGALSALYAGLVFTFLFTVEGGGFGSLAEVERLFSNRGALLAGWVHYLAFDLFIGVWIARRADAIGLSRIAQAPILVATFMLGPLGLLLFFAARAVLAPRSDEEISA